MSTSSASLPLLLVVQTARDLKLELSLSGNIVYARPATTERHQEWLAVGVVHDPGQPSPASPETTMYLGAPAPVSRSMQRLTPSSMLNEVTPLEPFYTSPAIPVMPASRLPERRESLRSSIQLRIPPQTPRERLCTSTFGRVARKSRLGRWTIARILGLRCLVCNRRAGYGGRCPNEEHNG